MPSPSIIERRFCERGFLPERDPLRAFPQDSPFAMLDELGQDLPSLLEDPGFRKYARSLRLPEWSPPDSAADLLPQLRLYYVRLGFLASAYINQVGPPPENILPANIAAPLCRACELLGRPPILSYDGYALYNWKRFDPAAPVALGNIDTLQNFVHMYDEHWFILVHVEIEAIASDMLAAVDAASTAFAAGDRAAVNRALEAIGAAVRRQIAVLRRIPEKMDPALYYRTFRPYIRFFDHVVYEGVSTAPLDYRGETGAQSSVIPALQAFMKVPHQPSILTNHLADMLNFMPAEHRALIGEIRNLPDVRPAAEKAVYNEVLEAMAVFREVHYGWAQEYIHRRTSDPRGTGGTPYMEWLRQLIDETRAHKIA
jgi:indoleamine 2,3-dioxygenase